MHRISERVLIAPDGKIALPEAVCAALGAFEGDAVAFEIDSAGEVTLRIEAARNHIDMPAAPEAARSAPALATTPPTRAPESPRQPERRPS